MSFNTLHRVLSSSSQRISDAAADYKKECHPVAQILKIVFSLGLKEAWDYFYNIPSKREAVEALEKSLQHPSPGWICDKGIQVQTEFEFEGEKYRAIDKNCNQFNSKDFMNYDSQTSTSDINNSYVLARFDVKKNRWCFVGNYSGSIYMLVRRFGDSSLIPAATGPQYNGL